MGRKRDTDLMGSLAKRLEGPEPDQPTTVPEPVAPPSPSAPRKRVRDDLRFVGFHTTEEQKEKLRVLSFETRRQNQELMREALDLLFEKHGMK